MNLPKARTRRTPAFAVVRIDGDHDPSSVMLSDIFTVKEVWLDETDAAREVERLNA